MNEIRSLGGRVPSGLPKVWVGYIIAAAFIVVGVGQAIVDPTTADRVTPLEILIFLGGWFYWLFCVYRIHKVIAEATNFSHPITPRQAVGYHFLPLYNLYWVFKWPNEIAKFVNDRVPSNKMPRSWAGFFLVVGVLVQGYVDSALGLAVVFSVGVYLTRKISRALVAEQRTEDQGEKGQGIVTNPYH